MEIDAEEIKDSPLILIKQGAEAGFESSFVGRRSIVKERFSKKYRHPTLDSKLTLKRLNAEARCMTMARRLGVSTLVLYAVDPLLHTLTFEHVEGPSVKDVFLEFGLHGTVEERLDDIAMQIGDSIGKLHDGGLIHGDLTTSNMLLRIDTNQLVAAFAVISLQIKAGILSLRDCVTMQGTLRQAVQWHTLQSHGQSNPEQEIYQMMCWLLEDHCKNDSWNLILTVNDLNFPLID